MNVLIEAEGTAAKNIACLVTNSVAALETKSLGLMSES